MNKEYIKKQKENFELAMEQYNENVRKIGTACKQAQEKYGFSYASIAAHAGVSDESVRKFLTGKTTPHILNACYIWRATKKLINKKTKIAN